MTKEQAKAKHMKLAEEAFEREWKAKQTCVYCLSGQNHLYHTSKWPDYMAGDW